MASGFVVVRQHQRMIVFRLGEFVGIAPPGFRFLIPFLYKSRIVNIREPDLNPILVDANAYVDRAFTYTFLGRDELAQRDVRQALNLGFDRALLEGIIQGAKE